MVTALMRRFLILDSELWLLEASSDYLGVSQLLDLVFRISQFSKDFIGMLTQGWRAPADAAWGSRQTYRGIR